jgi:hypothetical protein
MGDKRILLGKYPSYPGKIKITKVNFLMNFVSTEIRVNYLGKNPKNVGIIPWEKFRVHSELVPSKISTANIS